MDNETIDLIRQLLCRAGMAMEDVCDLAVAPPHELAALRQAAETILEALGRGAQFTAAAIALLSE